MGITPGARGTPGRFGGRTSARFGRGFDGPDFNQIVHGGTPWPNGISVSRLVQTRKAFDNRTLQNDNRAL